MLNEEFFDKKDKEILKLKQTIQAFKKYDEERKKFIQKLQWELEDVSEEYLNLKSTVPKDALEVEEQYKQKITDLKATVKGQNKRINSLQQIINLMKNPDALAKAEEVLKNYTVVQLKKLNDDLTQQVEFLRKTNSELIVRLIKFENINVNK